ncbi:putative lysosomal cobalamin transporter, partial [Lamellibrachia satsuma]
EDAISFVMSTMTAAGWLALVVYTAYGMSAWPVDLIRGSRSTAAERVDTVEALEETQARIHGIRSRYPGRSARMSSRDRQRLEQLEDHEQLIERRQSHLVVNEGSCLHRCSALLRPFKIAMAVLFILVATLIFISLILTNVDKLLHSLGPKMGYALPVRKLPNPIDIVLVYAQRVFPLDYILIAGFVLYLFLCSMAGIQRLGIWFCCIRVYKVRVRRTRPQGLLFLCFFLIFIVLALNVLVYEVAPQYTTYGSQHYWVSGRRTLLLCWLICSVTFTDECVMTRMAMLLVRFFYKVWIFGAAFYWASWLFIGTFFIGFIVSLVKRQRSPIEGEVESDDFYDSDDDML